MGPPIIPDEVLRTAFRRRAAGEGLNRVARDLGIHPNYLVLVLRGERRPNLFIELGSTLSSAYFTPERLAEAKERQERKRLLLAVEEEKRRKREAKRAACEKRRKDRLAGRAARRAQELVQPPRIISPEKRLIDEEHVGGLILEWQRTGDPRCFEQIIEASLALIRSALGFYRCLVHEESEEDELVNEMVLELNRRLPAFDPQLSGVFTFVVVTVRYHLMHDRTRRVRAASRRATLSEEFLEERGGFYQSPELPSEFRERLTDFTTVFTAPEELIAQRYVIYHLYQEGGFPSARQVLQTTGIQLPAERTKLLLNYVALRLRSMFAEDNLVPRLVETWVILSGRRLRVQICLRYIFSYDG